MKSRFFSSFRMTTRQFFTSFRMTNRFGVPRFRDGLLVVAAVLAFACLGFVVDSNGGQKVTLENGARVIVMPDTSTDLVGISVFVRAGAAEEGSWTGVGSVVAHGLFGSNQNQQSELVANSIYEVGGSLNVSWNPDYTLIECVTTQEQFENALYVICQAIKFADFEPETVKSARKAAAEDATKEGANPFRVAYAMVRSMMYRESAYRGPFGGRPESVGRMDRDKIVGYHQQRFTPANTVVSIVGNVPVERAEKAAHNYLIDYDRQSPRRSFTRPIEWPTQSDRRAVKLATNTAVIMAGFPVPGVADPDYPAVSVLTALIGGGKSSRLFRRLRDSAGIGYVVGAQTPGLAKENQLLAYVEYDPAHGQLPPEQVEARLLAVCRSVLSDPPQQSEIDRAKRYAAGSHALAHQRTRERAFYPGWYELCGPGFELDAEFGKRVGEVTASDIQRLAKKCLTVSCVATVLPEK